jgi:hypothetical protein
MTDGRRTPRSYLPTSSLRRPLVSPKSFSPSRQLRLRIWVMERTGWQAYERAHLGQEGLRGKIHPLKMPCDQAQLDVDSAKVLASVFVQHVSGC